MPGEYGWTGKQFKAGGVCFHKEQANIGKIGENVILNRTVSLWNDLPVKVKEAKSLIGFKAGLDELGLFSTGVCLRGVNGFHLD